MITGYTHTHTDTHTKPQMYLAQNLDMILLRHLAFIIFSSIWFNYACSRDGTFMKGRHYVLMVGILRLNSIWHLSGSSYQGGCRTHHGFSFCWRYFMKLMFDLIPIHIKRFLLFFCCPFLFSIKQNGNTQYSDLRGALLVSKKV